MFYSVEEIENILLYIWQEETEDFFNRRDLRNLTCRAKHSKPNQTKPNQVNKQNPHCHIRRSKKQNERSSSRKTMSANEDNLAINNLSWTSDKSFQSLEWWHFWNRLQQKQWELHSTVQQLKIQLGINYKAIYFTVGWNLKNQHVCLCY